MDRVVTIDPRRVAVMFVAGVASVVVATVLVALLEDRVGVDDASSAYLLAVVVMAVAFGSLAAGITAVASILVYDLFFLDPLHSVVVAAPSELLHLLLLLAVAIVVGRLAGRQRSRAEAALAREREARALFRVSRALATAETATSAMAEIVDTILDEGGMVRSWVTLGDGPGRQRITVDTDSSRAPVVGSTVNVLQRTPGNEPARWVRVHEPRAGAALEPPDPDVAAYRVAIEAAGRPLGWIWAFRSRALGRPRRGETRVLAAAADQLGQALERDRLAREATSSEIARRSDMLKSALLDSVSHDLRTPLASIRASAGLLMEPGVESDDGERWATAAAIDREAQRLDRLVTNLLDLSRIEAGELQLRASPFVLVDVVEAVVARLAPMLAHHQVTLAIPVELPPVLVDEVWLDQVVTNLLENVVRHTAPDVAVRVTGVASGDTVVLTVEDAGPGVPERDLERMFDRFQRVTRGGDGARRGSGVGLAVVKGLVEAMAGRVSARRSSLGGLAVDVELVAVPMRADDAAAPVAATPSGS